MQGCRLASAKFMHFIKIFQNSRLKKILNFWDWQVRVGEAGS